MKRAEFFSVAKITRSPVSVRQLEDKYEIFIEVKHEDEEEPTKYILESSIKSLNSVEKLLREQNILNFNISILNVEIPSTPRTPKQ